MSGDARSGLPTTAVCRDTATPLSIASMRAAGNVAEHVAGAEIAAHAAQPDQVGAQLREPHRRRHVQRLERVVAHHAVDRQTMTRLEAADRRLDIGVVDVGHARIGVEIAGRDQALAQRDDRGLAAAEPQPVRFRHLRPAALGDDALEMRDRLLGVLHGRGRQRRQRRLRHLDGARAGIEPLAEVRADVLIDQRFESRVLGERPRGCRGARRRGGAFRKAAQHGAAAVVTVVRRLRHSCPRDARARAPQNPESGPAGPRRSRNGCPDKPRSVASYGRIGPRRGDFVTHGAGLKTPGPRGRNSPGAWFAAKMVGG